MNISKLKSYTNSLTNKIWSRYKNTKLPSEDIVVPCHGMKILVRNPRQSLIGKSLFQTGLWEADVTEFITKRIKPGMLVLDIGADIGYYTLIFSKLTGKTGQVFSFEPIPQAKYYLDKNVELNQLDNVKTSEFALFDRNGKICLEKPFVDSRLNPMKETLSTNDIEVEMKVFDESTIDMGIQKIDLIKLDVEGAELNILKGMQKSLKKWKPALLVEVHPQQLPIFGFQTSDFLSFLLEIGYQLEPVDKTALDFSDGNITLFCEC